MGFWNADKCDWCGRKIQRGEFGDFAAIGEQLLNKGKNFCSKKCKKQYQASHGGGDTGGNGSNESDGRSARGSGFGGLMNGSLGGNTSQPADPKKEQLDEVTNLVFVDDMNQVQNDLNRLSTIAKNAKGGGLTPMGMTSNKQIRGAVKEKMEFGIMRLRGAGLTNEADFFDKKLSEIK